MAVSFIAYTSPFFTFQLWLEASLPSCAPPRPPPPTSTPTSMSMSTRGTASSWVLKSHRIRSRPPSDRQPLRAYGCPWGPATGWAQTTEATSGTSRCRRRQAGTWTATAGRWRPLTPRPSCTTTATPWRRQRRRRQRQWRRRRQFKTAIQVRKGLCIRQGVRRQSRHRPLIGSNFWRKRRMRRNQRRGIFYLFKGCHIPGQSFINLAHVKSLIWKQIVQSTNTSRTWFDMVCANHKRKGRF